MIAIYQTVENAQRTEVYGRPFLVAGIVMNVASVRHYPERTSEEYPEGYHSLTPMSAWDPESWNGKPIVANIHPQEGYTHVSARSPKWSDRVGIGEIYNVHIVGDRLVGDGWFDIHAMAKKAPQVLAALNTSSPLGCSIAASSAESTWMKGVHQGKHFDLMYTKVNPDHLAVFAYDRGRCSKSDGCGLNLGVQR